MISLKYTLPVIILLFCAEQAITSPYEHRWDALPRYLGHLHCSIPYDYPGSKLICNNPKLYALDKDFKIKYARRVKAVSGNQQLKNFLIAQFKVLPHAVTNCQYNINCIAHTLLRYRYCTEFKQNNHCPAFSWGGRVRSGPGIRTRQVGTTYKYQPIKIIFTPYTNKNTRFHQQLWYKIEYTDTKTHKKIIGYQWQKVICDPYNREQTHC